MVRILLLLLTLSLTACNEEKICDMEFPTMCHTKAEWKTISDNNWKAIECMEKFDKWLLKNNKKRPDEERLKKIYEYCGIKELNRVEFK